MKAFNIHALKERLKREDISRLASAVHHAMSQSGKLDVNRWSQRADVSAGKEQRIDDIAVRGEGQPVTERHQLGHALDGQSRADDQGVIATVDHGLGEGEQGFAGTVDRQHMARWIERFTSSPLP